MLGATSTTRVGLGWRTNFDAVAKYNFSSGAASAASAAEGDLIHVVLPDGNEYSFRRTSGVWRLVLPQVSPGLLIWDQYRNDLDVTVAAAGSGIEVRDEDGGKYLFDREGRLLSIKMPNGYTQSLSYSGGYNTKVSDSFGRMLQFEYWTGYQNGGMLKSVTLSDGQKILFDYGLPLSTLIGAVPVQGTSDNQLMVLTQVTYPDLTPATDTDNPKLVYEYLQSNDAPRALTGIFDERGVKYASWTYDGTGRATSSQHAGGADLTTFAYDDINGKVTVTNLLGRQTVYSFTTMLGLEKRLTAVDGIVSVNCAASNTAYQFDANGFRNQATDAESRVTKWVRDARGLPTSMTEGFGTPAVRTRTMAWHPSLPFPTQIVEPGLTTNMTYTGAGSIATISQVDTTATTVPYSTNGQTRATAYGYTPFTLPPPPVVGPTGTVLSDIVLSIANPGAETGNTGGWTNLIGTIGVSTSAPCDVSKCFFGASSDRASAYQDIPVPAGNISEVDSGLRALTVAWRQNSSQYTDRGGLRVAFLNQAGAVISSSLSEIRAESAWNNRQLTAFLPAGTRTIRLQMIMERTLGTSNDAYFDDIAVKLVGDGTAAKNPFLRVVNPDGSQLPVTGWTAHSSIGTRTADPCDIGQCFVAFGDPGTAAVDMVQTVAFTSDRFAEIDAGKRSLDLRWSDRAYGSAGLTRYKLYAALEFLNASGAVIANTNSVTAEVSPYGDLWSYRQFVFNIPSGARSVRTRMVFLKDPAGSINYTFLTGLSAQLVERDVPSGTIDLLTSVDGPLAGTGDKVLYGYDAGGNLAQVTNEIGQITQILALDGAGRPATLRDANGVDTTLAYDPRGRLTTVTVNPGASQAVTGLIYDAVGQVTRITRPDGSFLQYTYDNARRLTLVTNATGETVAYGYNLNGDVTSMTVKSATAVITRQMSLTYDELGRLLKSIGAATQTTTHSYDRTDLEVQVKDPRNNLYSYAYDSLTRLIRETDQEGSQVNLTRNGQDEVTAYADPRSLTTSYVRNGFGEAIQEASPDAGTTVFVRDLRGLVTQATDGRGIVANRTYDTAGRLLTETYPAATAENVTYTYDAIVSGNKGVGRLTKITDQSGTTEFTYNALGQVVTDKRTIGTKIYTTSYLYNAAGLVTQVTYPSGRIALYARNSLGQVTSVTSKQNATAALVNVATAIAYAPMSNLVTAMTHGNGLVTTAGYDLDYRLSTLQLKNGPANVSSLSYAYGDGMNLTAINDNVTVANSIALYYNPANRLQNANGAWGQSTFYYDGVGDRTYDINTVSGVTTTKIQGYPASSNRMANMSVNGTTSRTFLYDGNGNITSDARPGETFVVTYNKRNRPASVTRNAVAYASYGYNALEQLVSRSTSASGGPTGTVHYLYDLDGHLLAEADAATGATTRDYLWMAANDDTSIDLPLGVADISGTTSTLYQVHTDHLGRPIRMTDAAKATVWQASYKPWGEVQTLTGSKALNLRFPGQYFQIETGYHMNWHRHYDPTTGRYTQPDPLRFVDGPSVYAYAGNSPFMQTDREGLAALAKPLPLLEGGGGIGIGGPTGGQIMGGGAGIAIGELLRELWGMCRSIYNSKPPKDAHDQEGAKAPGKPSAAEGFKDPPGGEQWVANPNGKGNGWLDANGNVWVPTGQGGNAHGGPHWDVQGPRGTFGGSVYPGGHIR
jgi:RHS repeat-associated protein